jgi:hypothetical protein
MTTLIGVPGQNFRRASQPVIYLQLLRSAPQFNLVRISSFCQRLSSGVADRGGYAINEHDVWQRSTCWSWPRPAGPMAPGYVVVRLIRGGTRDESGAVRNRDPSHRSAGNSVMLDERVSILTSRHSCLIFDEECITPHWRNGRALPR